MTSSRHQSSSLSKRTPRQLRLGICWSAMLVPWQGIVSVALLCITAFLTFYRLGTYPWPDFDEGVHLLAARSLALEGSYVFGPAVGPTVLLPVAAAMRIFGATLLPARLVMTFYCVLSVSSFYTLARQLSGWKVSSVATLLYLISPGIMLIWFGRAVLGEVPALFFALTAILIWWKAVDERRPGQRRGMLVLCGVVMGLAILSKNQLLLLLPAWVAVWVMDRAYYHQTRSRNFVVPLLCALVTIAAWYAGQWLLFPNGRELALHNQETWAGAMGRGILTPSAARMSEALKFLSGQDAFYGWLLPACLYAGLRALRRSAEGLRLALLLAVVLVWLGWFVLLSVAWPRYAFLPMVLGALFVAQLLHDLTGGFRISGSSLRDLRLGHWDPMQVGRVALVALCLVILARSAQGRLYDLTARSNDYAQRMASYIRQQVPPEAVIETYDPEVCFLSAHVCHMPNSIMDTAVKYVFYGGPPPYQSYRFEELRVPFLLVGGSSKFYHIYDKQVVDRYYQLETAIGHYDLYRLRPGS